MISLLRGAGLLVNVREDPGYDKVLVEAIFVALCVFDDDVCSE